MSRSKAVDLLLPWLGLIGGGTAYGLFHQIGSDGNFHDCDAFSPWVVLIAGLLTLVAVALSGWQSWRIVRADGEGDARRVIATVSSLLALLLLFATLMPMIASIMMPPCFA